MLESPGYIQTCAHSVSRKDGHCTEYADVAINPASRILDLCRIRMSRKTVQDGSFCLTANKP